MDCHNQLALTEDPVAVDHFERAAENISAAKLGIWFT